MFWYKTDMHGKYRTKKKGDSLNAEELKILYRLPEDRGTAVDMAYIKSILGVYGHYADRSTPRDQVMDLVDRGLVRIVTHPKQGTGYEYFELTKEGLKLKKELKKRHSIESLVGSLFVAISLGILFYGSQIITPTGYVTKNIAMNKMYIIWPIIFVLLILGLYLLNKNLKHL